MPVSPEITRAVLLRRGESLAREVLELSAWASNTDPEIAAGAKDGLTLIREAVERVVIPTLALPE